MYVCKFLKVGCNMGWMIYVVWWVFDLYKLFISENNIIS